jgi:hypothetical protein
VIRRAVVRALDAACNLTHHTPANRWGCLLATWSDRLDRRWQTGVWDGEGVRIRENLQRSAWWWSR